MYEVCVEKGKIVEVAMSTFMEMSPLKHFIVCCIYMYNKNIQNEMRKTDKVKIVIQKENLNDYCVILSAGMDNIMNKLLSFSYESMYVVYMYVFLCILFASVHALKYVLFNVFHNLIFFACPVFYMAVYKYALDADAGE